MWSAYCEVSQLRGLNFKFVYQSIVNVTEKCYIFLLATLNGFEHFSSKNKICSKNSNLKEIMLTFSFLSSKQGFLRKKNQFEGNC